MSFISPLSRTSRRAHDMIRCPACNTQTAARIAAAYGQPAKIIPLLCCHHPPQEIPKNSDSEEGFFCETCFHSLSNPRCISEPTVPTEPADLSFIDTLDDRGASVVIWPKPYQRKHDGQYILYLNSEARCSLPISESSHIRERTPYQEILLAAFLAVLNEEPTVHFTGSYENHRGPKNHLAFGIDILVSNKRTIGGQAVPRDGTYIAWNEKLFRIA